MISPTYSDLLTIPVVIDLPHTQISTIESELSKVIKQLGDDNVSINTTKVKGEWQRLVKDGGREHLPLIGCDDCPVILWIHGGGFVSGSAANERWFTRTLAHLSNAVVFAVDYRLAPQNPFPAALVDVIVAYEFLVNPTPDAHHKPIDPTRIVVAGDSAGVHSVSNFPLIVGRLGNFTHVLPYDIQSTPITRGLYCAISSHRYH